MHIRRSGSGRESGVLGLGRSGRGSTYGSANRFGMPVRLNYWSIGLALSFLFCVGYLYIGSSDIDPEINTKGKGGDLKYGVIFDAGSSGSRVHIYSFEQNGGELVLQDEVFEQLKPGLSSYGQETSTDADVENSAKDNLSPLMETVMKTVPKHLQSKTPIVLRASAGLRMIEAKRSDRILQRVRDYFKEFPFTFADTDVSIMSGDDEGAYAWVTVNYLKKNIGKPAAKTSGVLDLGGGSTQIAFAATDEEAKLAKDSIMVKKFGKTSYNLYVHSYLGFGLNEARKTILTPKGNEAGICLPPAYAGSWEKLELIAKEDTDLTDNDSQCEAQVTTSLFKDKSCPTDRCAIQGIAQPDISGRDFHAFSFYYDRGIDAGLLDGISEVQSLTPADYKSIASQVCKLDDAAVGKLLPSITEEKDVPFQCVDHTYIYNLLNNLGFKDNAPLSLTKKINGVETGWCLGAMIEAIMNA